MKRMRPGPPHHRQQEMVHLHRKIWGVPLFSLFSALLMVLPCFYWANLYGRVAGRDAGFPALIAISFCWVLLVFAGLSAVSALRFHLRARGPEQLPHPTMFDDVIDALDRISSGDYDVFVQKQGHFHYSEIADKINRLARDLSSLEKMRQEFVSNVSHEIQSPLTSITGFATLLKKEDLPPEQRLHYLGIIEAESRRLSRLSENLLRLSVLDSEQPALSSKPFRLDKQLQDCLLLLEPQWAAKDIAPELVLDQVTCTGDEELLGQVWINLLHNSIKFTPPGGSITVNLRQDAQEIVCSVSDTGSGIPEDSLVRIFERFYKADKARDRSLGGNGLGLSIVHKIIGLHGGTISVESTVGFGTTFSVTLPVVGK